MNRVAIAELVVQALSEERIGWFEQLLVLQEKRPICFPVAKGNEAFDIPFIGGVTIARSDELANGLGRRLDAWRTISIDPKSIECLERLVDELERLPAGTEVGIATFIRDQVYPIGHAYIRMESGKLLGSIPLPPYLTSGEFRGHL